MNQPNIKFEVPIKECGPFNMEDWFLALGEIFLHVEQIYRTYKIPLEVFLPCL